MNRHKIVAILLGALFGVVLLGVVVALAMQGDIVMASIVLAVSAFSAYLFSSIKLYAYRYLYPSIMAFALFVIAPLVYTIYIAFTNFSGHHFQSLKGAQELILSEREIDVENSWAFKLYKTSTGEYQLSLEGSLPVEEVPVDRSTPSDSLATTLVNTPTTPKVLHYLSAPFSLPNETVEQPEEITAAEGVIPASATLVGLKDLISLQNRLKNIEVSLTDEVSVQLTSLTAFATVLHTWHLNDDGTILNNTTGVLLTPDMRKGAFLDAQGKQFGPGFKTFVGGKNFTEMFTNPAVRDPFAQVFAWTLAFSIITVITIFALGFFLAVILQSPGLKGRAIWRSLLILPYAVPAFISILIFKGLFNPQFGEINNLLFMLFGIRPEWTTDPMLARNMVILVNLWLGYPYMMLICMGILQSISTDIYEASAIDGGNAFSDMFKITLPLIVPPLKPLLIAVFAFNFNNFLLINLLTNGAPQIAGAGSLVGSTDILVTYTFNLAFRDAGANYGLASAIAAIIFIIVGTLSYLNLRLVLKKEKR